MNGTMQDKRKSLVQDARHVIEICAGLNLRAAARRVTQFIEGEMKDSGLTLAQFGLLASIAAASNDTIGDLARRTGLDQSTLSRNLRLLEQAGLVETVSVEKDLRRRAVWLTETGARRLEAALPQWRRAQEVLAEVLGPGQAGSLLEKTRQLP
jgi:DNA-binding MarR family transcriptional regulator